MDFIPLVIGRPNQDRQESLKENSWGSLFILDNCFMSHTFLWFYAECPIRILEPSYTFEIFHSIKAERNRHSLQSYFILNAIALAPEEHMRRISEKCFLLLKIPVSQNILIFFWKSVLVIILSLRRLNMGKGGNKS